MGASALPGAALTMVTTGSTYNPGATGATRITVSTSAADNKVTANDTGATDTNAVDTKDKDKNQITQAKIILPFTMDTLAKDLHKIMIDN